MPHCKRIGGGPWKTGQNLLIWHGMTHLANISGTSIFNVIQGRALPRAGRSIVWTTAPRARVDRPVAPSETWKSPATKTNWPELSEIQTYLKVNFPHTIMQYYLQIKQIQAKLICSLSGHSVWHCKLTNVTINCDQIVTLVPRLHRWKYNRGMPTKLWSKLANLQ